MRDLHQRYRRQLTPALVGYTLVMLLVWPLLERTQSVPLKIALALLPMLPTVFVVRAMVLLVIGSDELEQRIHLIALGIATTLVGTLSLAGGFLAAAGVLTLNGSILIWVFPALAGSYSAARSWAGRRYGIDSNEEMYASLRGLWIVIAVFAALPVIAYAWLSADQIRMIVIVDACLLAWALLVQLKLRRTRRRDGSSV